MLLPGEVKLSGIIVLVVGDTRVGAADKAGRLTVADIVMDEGTLRVWSGAVVKPSISRPLEAVAGIEVCREVDCAGLLSEEMV